MKINKRARCCDDCFLALLKESKKAVKYWMALADAQSHFGINGFVKGDSCDEIVLLENLGFLTTLDVIRFNPEPQNVILIKVKSREDDKKVLIYCGGNCYND